MKISPGGRGKRRGAAHGLKTVLAPSKSFQHRLSYHTGETKAHRDGGVCPVTLGGGVTAI